MPTDESSLVAWYRKGTKITESGSDVSRWGDSSSNAYDMLQATASEQPTIANNIVFHILFFINLLTYCLYH